jgi:hypothetical protein
MTLRERDRGVSEQDQNAWYVDALQQRSSSLSPRCSRCSSKPPAEVVSVSSIKSGQVRAVQLSFPAAAPVSTGVRGLVSRSSLWEMATPEGSTLIKRRWILDIVAIGAAGPFPDVWI